MSEPSAAVASSSTLDDAPGETREAGASHSATTDVYHLGAPNRAATFRTKETLTAAVKKWAVSRGFGVSICASDRTTVRFKCEHGGEYRARGQKGMRKAAPTRQKGCPFVLTGTMDYYLGDVWVIRDVYGYHSHQATPPEEMAKTPKARALAVQTVYNEIVTLSATLTPKEVVAELRKTHPDLYILPRDVSNVKTKHKRNVAHRKDMPFSEILRELAAIKDTWPANKRKMFSGLLHNMISPSTAQESITLFTRVFEAEIHRIRNPSDPLASADTEAAPPVNPTGFLVQPSIGQARSAAAQQRLADRGY